MTSAYISIIIPSFNSVNHLPFAIESIFAQTFKDFEVVIIDGGSADGTIDYVQKQQKVFRNLRYISEKDNGVYDAMNKGIEISSGKWLYFMGSDDTLYDSEVLGNVYHHTNNSFCKMIYGNVLINGNSGWAKDRQIYDGEFDVEKLFKRNISHQAIFYERSVFKKIGNYNGMYKVWADWDFNLRVASQFQLKYITATIANFNAGGSSTTQSDDQFRSDHHVNILKYFKGKIFSAYMSPFFILMIIEAGKKIKLGCYLEALYFLSAGYYHKVKNRLGRENSSS